jgi:hypothetical protein
MYDRRRYARFQVCDGWKGTLRILQDLTIEQYVDDELWVLSAHPARRDDILDLEIAGAGTVVSLKARVAAAEPVPNGGSVKHRLRLAILEAQDDVESVAPAVFPVEDAVQEPS